MKIVLYNLKQPALIVSRPTGLIYTNQTGGVACAHPEMEGFLVPLNDIKDDLFLPGWWYDTIPALDDALYDRLERVLNRSAFWCVRQIKVDREAKNQEAWIHVRFRGDFDHAGFTAGSFSRNPNVRDWKVEDYPEYTGVLTWENCD